MRILNVGCGPDTYGTDFLDLYPQRKEVKRCNLDKDKFPYDEEIFDEVYSKNNFEHLTNPLHFLNESKRVLKKGGRIIIITDNAGYYGIFSTAHQGGHEAAHKDNPNDRHYALFTTTHMKNWMEKAGFNKIEVKYNLTDPKDWKLRIAAKVNKKLHQQLVTIGVK